MLTRFNNETWQENKLWRERNEFNGCLYNTPIYIKEDIPILETLFVIEMNNETNKILGFGRINNRVHVDKKYNIHKDRNYNRHTYKGKLRIDMNHISNPTLIEKFEKLEDRLFRSKSHFKRGHGLQQLSPDLTSEYFKIISDLF